MENELNRIKEIEDKAMNYVGYFHACPDFEMDFGFHGPERKNDTVYISIYHYLEFKGVNPKLYDTFKLGNYLTGRSNGNIVVCKYGCQNFSINKFSIAILLSQESMFDSYLK